MVVPLSLVFPFTTPPPAAAHQISPDAPPLSESRSFSKKGDRMTAAARTGDHSVTTSPPARRKKGRKTDKRTAPAHPKRACDTDMACRLPASQSTGCLPRRSAWRHPFPRATAKVCRMSLPKSQDFGRCYSCAPDVSARRCIHFTAAGGRVNPPLAASYPRWTLLPPCEQQTGIVA